MKTLGFLFVFALLGMVSVPRLIDEGGERTAASVTMAVVALVAGSLLARREPVKSFLAARPVLWFLFLFNLVAGVVAAVTVDGAQGVLTGVGLCVVSLGAGVALVRNRRQPA